MLSAVATCRLKGVTGRVARLTKNDGTCTDVRGFPRVRGSLCLRAPTRPPQLSASPPPPSLSTQAALLPRTSCLHAPSSLPRSQQRSVTSPCSEVSLKTFPDPAWLPQAAEGLQGRQTATTAPSSPSSSTGPAAATLTQVQPFYEEGLPRSPPSLAAPGAPVTGGPVTGFYSLFLIFFPNVPVLWD